MGATDQTSRWYQIWHCASNCSTLQKRIALPVTLPKRQIALIPVRSDVHRTQTAKPVVTATTCWLLSISFNSLAYVPAFFHPPGTAEKGYRNTWLQSRRGGLTESSAQKSFDYLACAVHKHGHSRCSLSPLGTGLEGQVISLLFCPWKMRRSRCSVEKDICMWRRNKAWMFIEALF